MALTERSRSALYQGLSNIVDEEAVQEMMSFFPARDVEEPVTKEFLRAEMSDLRAEMSDLRAELKGDMASLRAEMKGDMSAMEHRLIERINRAQAWNVLAMIAFAGTIIAAVRI